MMKFIRSMRIGVPVIIASAVTSAVLLAALAFSALAGGTPRTHLTSYCVPVGAGHYRCYDNQDYPHGGLGDKPAHHVVQGRLGQHTPFSREGRCEFCTDEPVVSKARQIIRRDERIVRAIGPQNKFLTDAMVTADPPLDEGDSTPVDELPLYPVGLPDSGFDTTGPSFNPAHVDEPYFDIDVSIDHKPR